MRIVFMGTPEFSVPILEGLVEAGHEVVCVYCQPPRPAGRGKKTRASPVQIRADSLGLPVRTPVNLKDTALHEAFEDLNADVAVVVAYGLILPQAVLDAPRWGCLNIHASLLPRWRGAAPIHRAILTGDRQTGITIMQMDAGLDTGPVLLARSTDIGPDETTGDLHDRLSIMGAAAILEALSRLDTLTPLPQPEVGVTYAAKINKSEAHLDWRQSAESVCRKINGLSPFPGAFVHWNGTRLKILHARLAEGKGKAGVTIDDALIVACGSGAIQILRLQRAGKQAQSADEFLRGTAVPAGTGLFD